MCTVFYGLLRELNICNVIVQKSTANKVGGYGYYANAASM